MYSIFFVFFSFLSVEIRCVQGLHLWRNTASEVNDELYKGFHKGNSEGKVNEILAGCLLLPIGTFDILAWVLCWKSQFCSFYRF